MTPPLCPIPTPRAKSRDRIFKVASISCPGHSRTVRLHEDGTYECSCPARIVECRHVLSVQAMLAPVEGPEPTMSNCRCGRVEIFDAGVTAYCADCQIPMSDSWLMTPDTWAKFQAHTAAALKYDLFSDDCEEDTTDEEIEEWADHQGPRRAYQYRDSKPSLWMSDDLRDDSDPFAVAPVSAIPTSKPSSYYEGEFSTWL